jgi:hypothetical protein
MSSSVRDVLEGYVAGRVQADRLAIAVAAAYYGNAAGAKRESLRSIIDVIDRASPGVVELASREGPTGFEIRLAERAFPEAYEAELRSAAEAVLTGCGMQTWDSGLGGRGSGFSAVTAIHMPESRTPSPEPRVHPASRISAWIRGLYKWVLDA